MPNFLYWNLGQIVGYLGVDCAEPQFDARNSIIFKDNYVLACLGPGALWTQHNFEVIRVVNQSLAENSHSRGLQNEHLAIRVDDIVIVLDNNNSKIPGRVNFDLDCSLRYSATCENERSI
jgi:hypothetical protein